MKKNAKLELQKVASGKKAYLIFVLQEVVS